MLQMPITKTLLKPGIGIGAGGAVTWTPSSEGANLVLSWEFPFAQLTKSGGGTPIDGDVVQFGNDLSGNSHPWGQNTAASRPICHTDGTHNWLTFDGTNDFVSSVLNSVSLGATVAVTCTDASGQFTVLATINATLATAVRGIFSGDEGGTRLCQFRTNAGVLEGIAFDTLSNAYTDTGGSPGTATVAVVALVVKTNSVEVFINGVSAGSSATANTMQSAAAVLSMGGIAGASNFGGNIYGIEVIKRPMSAAELVGTVQTYMRALAP